MKSRLDIVGHFGTTFSYATVASEVARAAREAGFLATVSNIDPGWHESFTDLQALQGAEPGTHVLLFTPPSHYMDSFVRRYGRENSAIFMSPNTDRLSEEHAATCALFGVAITPSPWCEKVTYESCRSAVGAVLDPRAEDSMPDIWHLPLGVDPMLMGVGSARERGDTLNVLHFSTDQFWPGRKGTEELLAAWRMVCEAPGTTARLRLHVPPALDQDLLYLLREYDIDDAVEVVHGEATGSNVGVLADILRDADLVVAPSRCEGFGLMYLSALVAGVPLLCTAGTGQHAFLQHLDGWLGVPTVEWAPLSGEVGDAPVVGERALASALRTLLSGHDALAALQPSPRQVREEWLWPAVLERWTASLQEWMGGEIR